MVRKLKCFYVSLLKSMIMEMRRYKLYIDKITTVTDLSDAKKIFTTGLLLEVELCRYKSSLTIDMIIVITRIKTSNAASIININP